MSMGSTKDSDGSDGSDNEGSDSNDKRRPLISGRRGDTSPRGEDGTRGTHSGGASGKTGDQAQGGTHFGGAPAPKVRNKKESRGTHFGGASALVVDDQQANADAGRQDAIKIPKRKKQDKVLPERPKKNRGTHQDGAPAKCASPAIADFERSAWC